MKEQNFDTAYEEVKKLVAKFKQGENSYLSQSYSEAAVRQDFLDDFFTALGWDVRHQIQHDPYEQEVKIEQGVKVSGAQKRADYSFAIAPNFRDTKFFAEASGNKIFYQRDKGQLSRNPFRQFCQRLLEIQFGYRPIDGGRKKRRASSAFASI